MQSKLAFLQLIKPFYMSTFMDNIGFLFLFNQSKILLRQNYIGR